MKLKTLFFTAVLCTTCLFAETYKIDSVDYQITGQTWQYALEQDIKIDKKRVFESEEDFMNYFRDLQQLFHNQRNFASSELDFTVDEPNEENLCLVHIVAKTKDSHHFLAVPYPKYNSNSGLNLKLKVKDTNFLGSLQELSSDISFEIETDDDTDETNYVWGLSFAFDIPFAAGPFDIKWTNSWGASYTIGENTPEWDVTTGLVMALEFDTYSLEWTFKQSSSRDFDYAEFDDQTYFTEYAQFAIPITLQTIDNWGKVIYTPYVSATYNWDKNGIDKENDDLTSPLYKVGQGLSSSRVDWIGNFRQGLSLSLDQSIGYNTQRYEIVPAVSAETKIFLAFKYLGMNMDAYAYASQNGSVKIGERLRGIRDDQKYSTDNPEIDSEYATRPDCAIVVNMDMPFHIFTFNFTDSKYFSFLDVFNCELQIAPFFDFALARNKATGTNFWFKDGFYSGGLEFLVFPQKWRNIVVRASAGIDLGRTFVPSSYINTDWRKGVSKYELEIGVGLHY